MNSAEGIRVLACSDVFYPASGGGVLSLRAFCSGLERRGFVISTSYLGKLKDPAWNSHPQEFSSVMRGIWPRIWELRGRWEKAVSRIVESERIEVVIAQQGVVVPTIEACKRIGVPVVALIQGVDHFCLGSFWSGEPWKCRYKCVGCKDAGNRLLQFPFFRAELGRTRDAFRKADAIVTNSEFTKRILKMVWDIDSQVIPPIPKEVAPAHAPDPADKILFFSPLAHKGVAVAVEVCKSMSDEKFLFVGDARRRTRDEIRGMGNIEYLPWTTDTNALYRRSKLLIMPSLIPEGFGMACVEAMTTGIPCVVSDIGALPETVGNGGEIIHRYRDAQEWVKVLSKYRDSSYLEKKSKEAVKESSRYQNMRNVETMSAILKSLVET